MSEHKYDPGTQALLDDLLSKPQSFNRDEIIHRAKRFKYHEYKSDDPSPNVTLAKHLATAGFKDLAYNVVAGKYDQGPEESRKWAEETPEGRALTRQLQDDPRMQEQLDEILRLAKEQEGRLTDEGHKMIDDIAAGESAHERTLQPREVDSPDQRRLREVVTAEVKAVLDKHEVGGAVLLISRDAAAWAVVHPKWSGLQPDPEYVLRVRFRSKEPGGEARANNTMHFIACMRDMCSDYTNFYGRLWRQVVDVLKAQGATVEHAPFGKGEGVGGRPDPMGGKVE